MVFFIRFVKLYKENDFLSLNNIHYSIKIFMRTFMLFLLAAFALISCEDIQDNSPAMQVVLNDQLFKAIDARAEIMQDGTLVIQGLTDVEGLTITLNNSAEGVYTLGGNAINRAVFQDFLGSIYTTRPFGDGEVVIQNVTENTLTGTFKFNAYRFGLDTLNGQKGFFFKVPILAGTTSTEPVPPVNLMSATIDDSSFVAESVTAVDSNDLIVINGTRDNKTLTLSFPNTLTSGNNPIGGDLSASYTFEGTTFNAVTGIISIVNHNTTIKEISGAFSFETEGPDGVLVTQGQFNVSY